MDISAYTLQAWGLDQTIRYIDGLETCCQHLADNPGSGRLCDHIRPAWNMPGMSCFIGSNQGVS
jgi:plasmid stabilization system protein ParE